MELEFGHVIFCREGLIGYCVTGSVLVGRRFSVCQWFSPGFVCVSLWQKEQNEKEPTIFHLI